VRRRRIPEIIKGIKGHGLSSNRPVRSRGPIRVLWRWKKDGNSTNKSLTSLHARKSENVDGRLHTNTGGSNGGPGGNDEGKRIGKGDQDWNSFFKCEARDRKTGTLKNKAPGGKGFQAKGRPADPLGTTKNPWNVWSLSDKDIPTKP